MKKNLIRLLAAAMGAACVLSFAACGGNNASQGSSAASSAPASSAAEGGASSAKDLESCETVEDFINTGAMQEELDGLKEDLASSGMDVDITANGNQMIFTFTYPDAEETDAEALSSVLGPLTDSMGEVFEEMASGLAEIVEDDVSVVVKYVSEDGTELYSQEFAPAE